MTSDSLLFTSSLANTRTSVSAKALSAGSGVDDTPPATDVLPLMDAFDAVSDELTGTDFFPSCDAPSDTSDNAEWLRLPLSLMGFCLEAKLNLTLGVLFLLFLACVIVTVAIVQMRDDVFVNWQCYLDIPRVIYITIIRLQAESARRNCTPLCFQ